MAEKKNRWKKIKLIFDYDVKRKGNFIVVKVKLFHGTNQAEYKILIDPKDYPEG